MTLQEQLRKNAEERRLEVNKEIEAQKRNKIRTRDDFITVIEPYLSDLVLNRSKNYLPEEITMGKFLFKKRYRCISIPCKDCYISLGPEEHGIIETDITLHNRPLFIGHRDVEKFCRYHNLTLIYQTKNSTWLDNTEYCDIEYSFDYPVYGLHLVAYLIVI